MTIFDEHGNVISTTKSGDEVQAENRSLINENTNFEVQLDDSCRSNPNEEHQTSTPFNSRDKHARSPEKSPIVSCHDELKLQQMTPSRKKKGTCKQIPEETAEEVVSVDVGVQLEAAVTFPIPDLQGKTARALSMVLDGSTIPVSDIKLFDDLHVKQKSQYDKAEIDRYETVLANLQKQMKSLLRKWNITL